MDWIEGLHLPQYILTAPPQEERDEIGQRIWDLFMYQFHVLHLVHADPHPGNILITPMGDLAVIDFGCVKDIPVDFYEPFMELTAPGVLDDAELFERKLFDLEILLPEDGPDAKAYYTNLFHEVLSLLLKPYHNEQWDFGDAEFFDQIAKVGERMSRETLTSKYKLNRGSKHFIYVNRTFLGLYQLMHSLEARIRVPFVEEVPN
jgi:predicted unusual protein kinase regulating ubiquinone biosynthesis (AarF/ABC1/UbiB family)